MKRVARLALLPLLAALTACPIFTVTITSPAEGQRITGSRFVTVTGSVAGPPLERPCAIVSVNGRNRVYAPVIDAQFRAVVRLVDGENLIEVVVRAGGFSGKTALRVTYSAAEAPALAVAITAPADGDVLSGSRTTTVRGTVAGAPGAGVAVSVNGGAPVAAAVDGDTFSAEVELADGDNAIVASATAAGESASTTVHATYQAVASPTIEISSPAEGHVVRGHRTLTVLGKVAHVTSPSVLVSVDGGAPVAAAVADDGSYAAEVRLPDGPSSIVASVLAPEGAAAATVHVEYPFLALHTFQVAERVIGRPGPTAAAPDPCDDPAAAITGSDVCYPFGSASWDGGTLFVSDWARNRVLAFAGIPLEDGAAASFALGQPDLGTSAPSATAGGLAGPETVRVADGKLFVAEYANNRLLIFDPVPTGLGAAAAVAVGASSAHEAGSGACSPDGLLRPESFVVVGRRLIVADPGHNRVLVWNQIPTVSGTPADLVLGQPDLATCGANAGGVSAQSLQWPTDVWSDGDRLFVADAMNHRVLGWSSFPATSFAPADLVLGQGSFTSSAPGSARGSFRAPYFLTSNGNQLFVADQWNNRVLVWNSLPSASGALPDLVLGQADFDHAASNDGDQDGLSDAALDGRVLFWPAGVTATPEALVVTDEGNSRYLVFRAR